MLQSVSPTVLAASAGATTTPRARASAATAESEPAGVHDHLELSSAATDYAEHSVDESFRPEKVAEIRAQIDAGTYLTDQKLDVVVDRMHAEIFRRA